MRDIELSYSKSRVSLYNYFLSMYKWGKKMAQVLDQRSAASTYVEPSERPITTITAYSGYQTGKGLHETITFTVDREIGAAYFRLKPIEGEVESIEFDAKAILDVDKTGQAVGLELLFGSKEALEALLLSLRKEGSDKR